MARESAAGVPFERRLRTFLRAQRFPLSVLVFAIGVFLSLLALGDFTPLSQVEPFHSINAVTDTSQANYNLLFIVIGPIIAIVGAYLVGAYLVARRRFEHLMRTKSKAEFLRNLPDLERLLWDLTPRDEMRYLEKKSELRLRR